MASAPLKAGFHFDFGCPGAYLAELALPGIERRTGVKFEYVPVLNEVLPAAASCAGAPVAVANEVTTTSALKVNVFM